MGREEAIKFWKFFETMPKNVQLNYMNVRFGELAFDISRDWEEYKSEYELLEKFKLKLENEESFNIPSMCIDKDDLKSRFEDRDDEAERYAKIDLLTNDDMQFMANQMTDMMMEDFWFALDEAYNVLQQENKQREE